MKAIIDVDELRRFISTFGHIRGMMREKKEYINGEFKSLGEVWKDKNYQQFEKTFSLTVVEIEQFLRHAEAYSDYLRRKADAADRYLEGGY
jgi:hypothetical protein